jgi:molecular chaperone Hsp33
LGADEANSILHERGEIEVGCDFCGLQYRYDGVDVARMYRQTDQTPPASDAVH